MNTLGGMNGRSLASAQTYCAYYHMTFEADTSKGSRQGLALPLTYNSLYLIMHTCWFGPAGRCITCAANTAVAADVNITCAARAANAAGGSIACTLSTALAAHARPPCVPKGLITEPSVCKSNHWAVLSSKIGISYTRSRTSLHFKLLT